MSEGYIVEFRTLGQQVKVSAVDPETGREVSIVGPASAGQKKLAEIAVQKLKYVLEKEKNA